MNIGEIATLQSLLNYSNLKKNNPDEEFVFEKAYVPNNNGSIEYLKVLNVRDLTIWQRILRFFGASDFQYKTIAKLITQAGKSLVVFKPTVTELGQLHSVVKGINDEIDKKEKDRFLGIFQRSIIPRIDIPVFGAFGRRVISSSGMGKRPATLHQHAAQGVSASEALEPPKTVKGIINPGCLCYCNASLKALWASAGFRQMLGGISTQERNC